MKIFDERSDEDDIPVLNGSSSSGVGCSDPTSRIDKWKKPKKVGLACIEPCATGTLQNNFIKETKDGYQFF